MASFVFRAISTRVSAPPARKIVPRKQITSAAKIAGKKVRVSSRSRPPPSKLSKIAKIPKPVGMTTIKMQIDANTLIIQFRNSIYTYAVEPDGRAQVKLSSGEWKTYPSEEMVKRDVDLWTGSKETTWNRE